VARRSVPPLTMELAASPFETKGRGAPFHPPILPALALYLSGGAVWALSMAASAFISLTLQGRVETFHLQKILAVYSAGGLGGWLLAVPLARLFTRPRCIETRFAAHFALLCLCTIGITAVVFAMDYRLFYAQWHEPFGTRIWLYQFVFTLIGASYQFLVMGLGLYLPAGLPLLAGVSLWLSRSIR